MIELYKIFMGKYDSDITLNTIGNEYRDNMIREIIDLHCTSHIYSMICVNCFPNRIIPLWDSLSDYVVSSPYSKNI